MLMVSHTFYRATLLQCIALLALALLVAACDNNPPRPPDVTPVPTLVVVESTATTVDVRLYNSSVTPVASVGPGQQSGAPTASVPMPTFSAKVIQRVETDKPYVAVTVDDFYTADYRRGAAVHILQEANAEHISLTLCPAGSALTVYARKHADQASQIKALVAQGSYELCNHTYTHPVMRKLSVQAQEQEMIRGRVAQHSFFGHDPDPIFRPPFGSWNAQTVQAANLAGYPTIVTWSVDSGDSEGPEKPPQKLLADVACARAGDIILMHANRNSSADALPLIIDMLRKKGLQPVILSTLLASGKPVYSTNPDDMKHLYTCK